jgi:hypothetical protein
MKLRKSYRAAASEIRRCGGDPTPTDEMDLADIWTGICGSRYRPADASEEEYIVDAYLDYESCEYEPDLIIEHGYIS